MTIWHFMIQAIKSPYAQVERIQRDIGYFERTYTKQLGFALNVE